MATFTFCQLQEFQPDVESIDAYLERVEMYFLANEIPAGKQIPMFLSVVRGKTHALVIDAGEVTISLQPADLKM